MIRGEEGPTCLQCGYVDVKVPEWIRDEGRLRREPSWGKLRL